MRFGRRGMGITAVAVGAMALLAGCAVPPPAPQPPQGPRANGGPFTPPEITAPQLPGTPAPGTGPVAARSVGFRGAPSALRVIDGPATAPAGTTWNTTYNYLEVRARDLTLDGVLVKGGIDFYGAGTLTVRNSIVEFGYGSWITVHGRTSGATIDVRDSTLRWRPGAAPSVGSGNGAIQIGASVTIVALRNDISGTADGIQAAGPNTRIEENWIHDLALVGTYPNNTHNDGVQVYDGQGMVIARNRIDIGFDGQHQNAALFFQPGGGNSIGVTVRDNYLAGGGYVLRFEGPTTAAVERNVFGPLVGGAWGQAYRWAPAVVTAWTANTNADGSAVARP